MNEILFFSQIIILISFLMVSLKLGKNALIVFVCMQTVFANLFVTKQIELFSLTVTCSDVYAVSAIFGLNLLQEYFEKKEAKKTIYLSFVFLSFFMIVAKMHLLYLPSSVDKTHNAFFIILSHAPRIILASISVFFLVQWIDYYVYGFFKKRYGARSLIFRLGLTSIFTQFIDTFLFSFLGLFNIVENIWDVIFLSFFIKTVTILSSSFFIAAITKFSNFKIKHVEKL